MTTRPVKSHPVKSTDPLIICAYWLTLLLSIIAVILSAFLGMLLLSSSGSGPISLWVLFPFFYAGLCLIYLDVLAREYRRPDTQLPLFKLALILAVGAVALVALAHSIVTSADDSGSVVVLPFLIGCLSFAAVCQITSAKHQIRTAP